MENSEKWKILKFCNATEWKILKNSIPMISGRKFRSNATEITTLMMFSITMRIRNYSTFWIMFSRHLIDGT
jgi:hypothetical protein